MKRKVFKDIIYPTLILAVICLVITLLLTLTNNLTKDLIDNDTLDIDTVKDILKTDSDNLKINNLSDTAYEILENDEVKGYVIIAVEGTNYPVKVMTGIKKDGSVSGVRILSNSGTPGYGDKIEDESFLDQFVKESGVDKFIPVKKTPESDDEILVVTSATGSSETAINAVNKCIDEYKRLIGG